MRLAVRAGWRDEVLSKRNERKSGRTSLKLHFIPPDGKPVCVPCMSSAPTTVGVNKFQKYKYLFNNQRFWVT